MAEERLVAIKEARMSYLDVFKTSVDELVRNPSQETALDANLNAILADDFLIDQCENEESGWIETRYFTQFLTDLYRAFESMRPLRRDYHVDYYAHKIARRYNKFTELFDKGRIEGDKIMFDRSVFI